MYKIRLFTDWIPPPYLACSPDCKAVIPRAFTQKHSLQDEKSKNENQRPVPLR